LNRKNKIWRLVPVTIIGFFLNYKIVRDADDEFIFNLFIIGGLFFLFLIALMWTNIKDIKEYKQFKFKSSFLPTIIGLLFAFSFFATNYVLKSRDNSPIIIQAGHDGGFNGAWFEFREDGTYKFGNSGGIGATYTRGNYIIKDSIITLDKSNIDNLTLSKKLVIREVKIQGWKTKNIIYQINDKNEITDKEFAFIINTDNRKK
jgi:hypothetical protein